MHRGGIKIQISSGCYRTLRAKAITFVYYMKPVGKERAVGVKFDFLTFVFPLDPFRTYRETGKLPGNLSEFSRHPPTRTPTPKLNN